MKGLFAGKPARLAAFSAGLLLLGFALLNAAGYLFHANELSVFAAANEIDKYQVRASLLMDATNEIGAASPEEAANVWADGLKKRSGALQYAVMTSDLKAKYASDLEKKFPNWVTGVSSPWVDRFDILQQTGLDPNWCGVRLRIYTKTSAGPAGNYDVSLSIMKQGSHWLIAGINADRALNVYTGFLP